MKESGSNLKVCYGASLLVLIFLGSKLICVCVICLWPWMLLSLLLFPLYYGIYYFALVYLVFKRFMKKQKFSMAARFLNTCRVSLFFYR
jgi:hypothetical protein